MKKFLKSIAIAISLSLSLSVVSFAHSGRTDEYGGHHDYKNISGLGSYHYHHGYPAHLHPNGVCPYDTPPAETAEQAPTSTAPAATPSATPAEKKTAVSDIQAYINFVFIPSFNYEGSTYIVAEDLSQYGYDVVWDGTARTLKIARKADKAVIASEASNPSVSYTIEASDVTTLLYNKDTNGYDTITSYNIGGKTIVKITDIGGGATWDPVERIIDITV